MFVNMSDVQKSTATCISSVQALAGMGKLIRNGFVGLYLAMYQFSVETGHCLCGRDTELGLYCRN